MAHPLLGRASVRVFLSILTIAATSTSLVACAAVDAVATPYGEERPPEGFIEAAPHDGPQPPRCKPDGAFTRREEFYSHAGMRVFGVRLVPDESVAYGTVIVDDVWTLARIEPGRAPLMNAIAVGPSAGYPSLTADGKTLFFARREGDLFMSRRAARTEVFTDPSTLPPIASADEETSPYVTPDGAALYFTRREHDHYVIRRTDLPAAEGSDSSAFSVGSAPAGDNSNPVVTNDELTIFFAARNGRGDLDIWTAQQPSKGARFRDAHPIAELRTSDDDVPSWISPDACVLYFERWSTPTSVKVMRAYREPL